MLSVRVNRGNGLIKPYCAAKVVSALVILTCCIKFVFYTSSNNDHQCNILLIIYMYYKYLLFC